MVDAVATLGCDNCRFSMLLPLHTSDDAVAITSLSNYKIASSKPYPPTTGRMLFLITATIFVLFCHPSFVAGACSHLLHRCCGCAVAQFLPSLVTGGLHQPVIGAPHVLVRCQVGSISAGGDDEERFEASFRCRPVALLFRASC